MRFVLCMILGFLSGCTQNHHHYEPSDKENLSNEILFKVAMQLKKEKKLQPFGSGGGAMGNIRMLYLAFQYYEQVDVDKARQLLMESADVFLKTINEDERVRPYLKNYPFLPENIEMKIFFKKADGSDVDPEKLCLVGLSSQEQIRYKTIDPKTKHLVTIHDETYSEASEKLGKKICL